MISVGNPLHILTGIAPGMLPYTKVELGLGMEIGMDLGIVLDRALHLTPGTEEDTPPGLAQSICLDRDPGISGGTPPQPLLDIALGCLEDMEELCMAACTVAH